MSCDLVSREETKVAPFELCTPALLDELAYARIKILFKGQTRKQANNIGDSGAKHIDTSSGTTSKTEEDYKGVVAVTERCTTDGARLRSNQRTATTKGPVHAVAPINSWTDAHRSGCGFTRREPSKTHDRSDAATFPGEPRCTPSNTALSRARSKGGGTRSALPPALNIPCSNGENLTQGLLTAKSSGMLARPHTRYASNETSAAKASHSRARRLCCRRRRPLRCDTSHASYHAFSGQNGLLQGFHAGGHLTADKAADGLRKSLFLPPPMASKAFLGAGAPGIGAPGIMFFGLLMLGRAGVCSIPGW